VTHLSREMLADWRHRPTEALRAEVVPHLAACRECAATYAELVRADVPDTGPVHFNPADFTPRGLEIGTRALAGSRWSRAWRSVSSIGRAASSAPATVRWALAAQLALILALGGTLMLSRLQAPDYTTLSGGTGDVTGARLTVLFEPAATAERIQQVLATVGGSIVSGPSAAGVYVVALPLSAEAAAVDARIEALREQTGVIRFVEREP